MNTSTKVVLITIIMHIVGRMCRMVYDYVISIENRLAINRKSITRLDYICNNR